MLPDAWISKIFAKFEGRYGALFLDRWRGCDMANIRETWAEELAGFHDQPERIAYALKALADQQFPPTLPEFIAACRRAPGAEPQALPHYPSEAERARAQAAAAEVAHIARGNGRDHLAWAMNPQSQCACSAVFEGAGKDLRLRGIRDTLIRTGVASESGQLLRRHYP